MKKNTANKNISAPGYSLIFLFIVFFISSCNPTKYVPAEDTLLDENHVTISKDGVEKSELMPYLKQRPNKRIFGVKFHLGLYNLSNINKEKWPHGWLREIGEEPAIFDPYAVTKSAGQIKSYLSSKGYFDSNVMETIETANRQSKVYYNVDLKTPYTIRNLFFEMADTSIRELFYFDSVDCMIERGKPYDVDVLQAERSRLERFVKDKGFYGFSGDHIYFNIDSTIGNRQVDIHYGIKEFQKVDENNRITLVPHSMYRVRNIYIYPDFVPKNALEGGAEYLESLDTINYRGYYFITSKEESEIKNDLIIQSLYLKPGLLFNVTSTEQTQSHLLSLKTFRLVNIFYNEVIDPNTTYASELSLDCTIQLTLLSQQSYKVELEGTNTAGYLGGALNLIYQHKNLFHGAELFNLKLKGSYEALSQKDTLRSVQEYGIETSLRFPKFLFPFLEKERFVKEYNPTTTLLAAYNYQDMPTYARTMANATFGYTWNGKNYTSHIVNPVQLNLVDLLRIDPDWQAWIDSSSYLKAAYRDVMILGGGYSYIFNNQKIKKSNDYWFVRINAEATGNMLRMVSRLAGIEKTDGSYNILGQTFAQYIRADMDMRYNVIINDVSSAVYRGFIGAGIPYGNSKAIPFEKQYFGGGANGIRAWQVRTLGPGSSIPDTARFLNQTADIKLEVNAEYRFKLFWILNGALFLDAGNIWSFNDDPATPGSQFRINSFLNEIAVGTGAGIRFDLSFVLLRADMGMKLRDPAIADGSRWIIMNRPYSFGDDFTFVIGIGYPF
ncbi:MAG: BamA/TamA family outer membrane protein [Bacteroidia bacterium]|nr:BamA/TamA family outer membrane protein [Bacteroidia bacterium]